MQINNALQVVSVSYSFYEIFKVTPDEVVQQPIYELGNRQWDIPALRVLLKAVVENGEVFDNYLVEHDFPIIGHREMLLNARRIVNRTDDAQLILLAMEEVK